MKNLLVCLLLSALISGCGLFKKTTLKKSLVKSNSIEKLDIATHKIDRSTIVIKDRVDTAIKIPGYQQTAIWKLNPLFPGQRFNGFDTSTKDIDSSFTDVKLFYDSLSNAVQVLVKAKDQLIPVTLNRTTEINKDITVDSTSSGKKQVKTSAEQVHKVSSPDYSWLIYAAVAAIVLFLFYKISNRIKH
jgi:hypothetical protein